MKTLKNWKSGYSVAGAILIGALTTLPARAQNYPSQILSQSPIDYWRFSEKAVSPAINTVANLGSAGVAGTGYVVGGATLGEPGIVGNAIYFTNAGQSTGNCTARIDIPNIAALNPAPPFSVEFWAKPNAPLNPSDSTGLAPISSLSVDGSSAFEGARSGYVFYVNPTSWAFRLGGLQSYSAVVTANGTVSTASWTHIVGEFDGTTASLYLNGVLAASSPVTGGAFLPNPFMPTRIGGTTLPGAEYEDGNAAPVIEGGNRGWDGLIDKVAIYSSLLSSNVVMAHYTAGTSASAGYDATILASDPVGYWNFNEPAYTAPSPSTYTFAADIGSLVDDGTNTLGSLADQPGVPGLSNGDKSVFYSGAAGSLVLDTDVPPPDLAGLPITLAAWIKPDSFGYVQDIIAQGYDETSYAENFLRTGDSYDWAYFQDDASYGNYNTNVIPGVDYYEIGTFNGGINGIQGYISAVMPAPAGDIGHWVFLVGTYDGAQWNLYRNGVLQGVFPDGGIGPSTVATAGGVTHPWSVGSRSNPNPYMGMFFAGSIAEPAILTNALTPAQVLQLYNSVGLPPVITQAPVAPSPAYIGSSATFSVWADGPGTLYYQWYSNNVPVVGQTATNLSLTSLIPSYSATYSVIVTNAFGAVTSSVVLVVVDSLPPITVVPAAETRWLGSPLSFAPASLPAVQLTYQWDLNGQPISGATQSNYTATTSAGTVGSYTLVISNTYSVATSSVATLTAKAIPTNTIYPATILADDPLAYLRLDETSGTVAHDYAGGNNGTYTGNITLGVPGYSLVDTDTAAYFPGEALSYVGGIGPETINFGGTAAEFTIEAWANGGSAQAAGAAVIVKGHSNNGTTANEQFAIIVNSGQYEFFVRDDKGAGVGVQSTFAPDGNWHLFDGVCDEIGGTLTFYIDGQPVGSAGLGSLAAAGGIISSLDPVSIGAESSGPSPSYDLPYNGAISQVAIYASALSQTKVSNHFAAAYGPNLAPFILTQPVSATNYYNLPVTLSVGAAGTLPLSFQWNMVGSGPISGATGSSFTIPNLTYANAGTYTVGITNTINANVVTGLVSLPVTITVLAPPTNPPAIPGLVMHLTFDNDLIDATGRGNNATNEASGGALLITNDYQPGQIGQAFIYQTTVNSTTTNANYASVGVRPDLQFGSTVSFTVSFWIQEPLYFTGNDLPFFCDVIGSTFGHPGYCFEPSFGQTVGTTAGWPGSWGFSVYDSADAGTGVYGDQKTPGYIFDGQFHNLIYVIDRVNGATVYLDGVLAHQNRQAGTTVAGIGDIDSTNAATIGQDPTGLYPQSSQGSTFAIDDLGVWRKALTPLEAASIYSAGSVNQLSFAGVPLTFTQQVLPGHQLVLTWNEGQLQSATDLRGPWKAVPGATSPYTNSPTAASTFFRIYF